MIEVAKTYVQQLIVILFLRQLRCQLYTHIIACETVHGLSACGFLEEHLLLRADILLIEADTLLLAEVEQLLAALFFVSVCHYVRDAQGCGSGTFAVREDMQLGDIHRRKEAETLLEAFLRLSTTAHHHVHTDEGIGHAVLYQLNLVSEKLLVITAMHESEHLVAAALERNVEVRHEGTALCTEADKLVREQIRLHAADAITLDALHAVKGFHQVEAALAGGLAEVANVNAREHYLLSALFSRLTRLADEGSDGGIA